MEPVQPPPPQEPANVVNAAPPPQKASPVTKKAILFLIGIALAATAVVLAAITFLPQRDTGQETAREVENPFEQAINPFGEDTYQNPFEATPAADQEYQNPFEELR